MALNQNWFPQTNGFGQPMTQPMYQPQTYQPLQPQSNADQPFFCRAATNREEVQAWPVDFSGRPMTFLGPNLQNVWIKTFNANTGGSDVAEYRKVTPLIEEPAKADFVTAADFQQLRNLVEELSDELNKLRTARRRAAREQEVNSDEV